MEPIFPGIFLREMPFYLCDHLIHYERWHDAADVLFSMHFRVFSFSVISWMFSYMTLHESFIQISVGKIVAINGNRVPFKTYIK